MLNSDDEKTPAPDPAASDRTEFTENAFSSDASSANKATNQTDATESESEVYFTRVKLPPSSEQTESAKPSNSTGSSDAGSRPETSAVPPNSVRISGWGGHSIPDEVCVSDSPSETNESPEITKVAVAKLETASKDTVAVNESPGTQRRQRNDPISQTFMLMLTMALMLLAARFAVPRIVEEVRYSWHRGELRAEYEVGGEGLRNVSLDTLSQAYQMVTSAVGPTVVHIDVERASGASLAGEITGQQAFPTSDQGSGVIIDAKGYVITNRHVISDGAKIVVTLSDGRRVDAQVIGTDQLTDLAVLKIDATGLLPIRWGDSDRCNVGCPVWAVGSPFGLDRTVTFGILSGKHRVVRTGSQHGSSSQYQDFMQSDVAVNPGNSGGPLVDARGTLIGINTAIVGDTYQGVSFSIPSSVARQVYNRILSTGFVDRGWLGVVLTEVPDEQLIGGDPRSRGALVTEIADETSPAAAAGLQPGDVILKIDNAAISDMSHLMRVVGDKMAGATVAIDLSRNGKSMKLSVKLGSRPIRLN